MTLTVLRRVSTFEEAVVMASALRSAGIEAEVFDILGQMRWTLQTALGGFRVIALASEMAEAREFLSAPPPSGDDYEPSRPPTARRIQKFPTLILIAMGG